MRKFRELKDRSKTRIKKIFGSADGSTTPPAMAHGNRPGASESGVWPLVKLQAWANLKVFLKTVNHATSISGLGPVKNVVEAFANCIGIYEEAAQNRSDYDELRVKLESTFDELNQYFSASPIITPSIENICGRKSSIHKELEYLKAQRARTVGRRFAEAGMADTILECYRRMQDHLQRLSRNANLSTWIIVDQLATDHRLQKLAPSLSACYNSEKAAELKRGPCTEGTRINVLLQMCEWATSRNSEGVYWMNGMAGTGKTTIAYSLCEQLDTENNRLLCASFFCSRSLPECRSVGRIIPSIAYQIAQCSRPFRYALSKATEENPDAHTRLVRLQFESLITKPLSDIKVRDALPKHMVVVIDALDECEDITSTQQMLEVLLTMSKDLPIKFVVSCRPEASIRHQMERNGTWVTSQVVLHELDSREVQNDIKKYLTTKLSPINPTEDIIKQLADRAGVLFIYAATVIRYVGYDDFGRNPRARLNAVLGLNQQQGSSQTEEIDRLYAAILEVGISDKQLSKTERDDIKLVLNAVICAKVPLPVDGLNALLRLGDVGRVNAALRPLWSVLHVKGPNMLVTTLHASFPEYLTDPERSGNSMWHCDLAIHHHILAQRCFECIRDARPQFNICQLESSYLSDNEVVGLDERVEKLIPVELRYACRYWSAHLYASDSSASSSLLSLLEQFLSNNLLLWLEVMSLTHDVSTTPEEVATVSRWAVRHGATQGLIDLVRDAWRFTATVVSSPVGQSTPHIYVSMLPFLPSHSPIRKHYIHRAHGMINVEGTARDQRKGQLGGWVAAPSESAAFSPDHTLVAIAPKDSEGLILLLDLLNGCLVRNMSHDLCSGHLDGDMFHHPTKEHLDDNISHDLSGGYSGPKKALFPLEERSKNNACGIMSLAFSPNNACVASGTLKGTIWVWDVQSGQPILGPLTGHTKAIYSLVYSHGGSLIISGSDDCTVCMWDATTGKPVGTPLLGHTDIVRSIATSQRDNQIVSGSYDKTIRVWNMQTGRPVFDPITGHTGYVTSVAISPTGELVVSGSSDHTVYVWDIQTGQVVAGPFSLPIWAYSVAISPDNVHISIGLVVGSIQIWDLTTGTPVSGQLRAHLQAVSVLMYSPDGTRIISYSDDGSLSLFDAHSATVADDTLLVDPESILSIDISSDGKHIVSGSDRDTLRIWDRMNGELVYGPLTGHTASVHFVRYSPDGGRILSCSDDGTLRQWDARNGGPIRVYSLNEYPSSSQLSLPFYIFRCATYSPDGCYIATASSGSGICVWGSDSDEWVLGFTELRVLSIEFTADGMTLIAGCKDGTVQMWNAKTGELVSSIQPRSILDVSAFAFSADRLYNVLVDDVLPQRSNLQRSVTRTGESAPGAFDGHTNNVSSVQFSPDGTRIVSGSWDKTVHVWDANTGTSISGALTGHTDDINSVAYSPDGTYVASASDDTTIRIWDATMQPNPSKVTIVTP
ncbi:unnamed protein product [Rhizoctonia solani]|uniref:Nephrocystin 3-like N-terminal domain-containing protein n=1 Tax=Rhizoctonia solani TaxID=456999 RepID=A0A8H3HL08_9AGAM|nr:unnamed protein product [Rhizoctonia solani]